MKKLTLKEAVASDRLKQFIKERKGETGDQAAFDKAISSMAQGKSPKAQEASPQEKNES